MAKTTSIPRHPLPLSKTRLIAANLLSATVVLGLDRFFAFVPAAGSQSAVLQGVEHAQNLLRVAAHGEICDGDEADLVFRVHDEGGALADAGVGVQDAQRRRELALDVGEHGEGQVLQGWLLIAPRPMNELRVDAGAQNLRIAVGELLVQLAEGGNLSGTDESEVLGPEEVDLPLAFKAVFGEGFKGLLEVEIDRKSTRLNS